MISIIRISNVKAVELDTSYFKQSSFDVDEYLTNVATTNNINLNDYDVFIYAAFSNYKYNYGNNYFISYFIPNSENAIYRYLEDHGVIYAFYGNTNTHTSFAYTKYFYKEKIDLTRINYTLSTYTHSMTSSSYINGNPNTKMILLYATDNIYYYDSDELYYLVNPEPKIEVNVTDVSEMISQNNTHNAKNVAVNFNDFYDENYQYYLTTDKVNLNITDEVNEAYNQTNNAIYNYLLRYNSNVTVKILNGDVEISSKSITISDLNEFKINLISANQANDILNRDVIVYYFDFKDCYEPNFSYKYSYDNVTFYSIDLDNETRTFLLNKALNLNIYFKIYDELNNEIYAQSFNYDDIDYSLRDLIDRSVGISEDYTNENGVKAIKVSYDFSEYSQFRDIYNIKIYVDNILQDADVVSVKLTSTNYKPGIQYKVYIDSYLLVDKGHRVGAISSGGGSDYEFGEAYEAIVEDKLNDNSYNLTTSNDIFKFILNFIENMFIFMADILDLLIEFFNMLNTLLKNTIVFLFVNWLITRIIILTRR